MLLFEPVEHGERQDLWSPAWRKEVKELYSYLRLCLMWKQKLAFLRHMSWARVCTGTLHAVSG